jgi:hypothetical protein
MDRNRFRSLLSDLHQELRSTDSLDPQSRELVEQLLKDIDRIGGPREPDRREAAAAGLRDVVLRFESEHPRLSQLAGQVADALGKLGI